jgi:uncharacterized protein YbcV (DUF1398 family)
MFTIEQIENAHQKVKSGADFLKYIQEIKRLGVKSYETWVSDNRTVYFGEESYQTQSLPKYDCLTIANNSDKALLIYYLKMHQQGEIDYFQFCQRCAETGVEKWIVDLDKLTCTYFDKDQNNVLTEPIPA